MNRYQLQEVIGRGGMGTVYRALDCTLDRPVAIKFINQNEMTDQETVDRFFREARATAKLQHPNIIQVFDMGQDGASYYMVMELLDGSTLKDVILERAPLPVAEAAQIAIEILQGLGEAHRVGVIHRDIKPQNILRSVRGQWKLADFGIAHMVSASTKLTKTGMMIGTVHYFSPEQAKGEPISFGSDLYAVGVILYEMLTGHLPFDAEEGIAIAIKHIQSPVPDPRVLRPDLPERVCQILFRALEKNLHNRYQSAEEMITDLQLLTTQEEPYVPSITTSQDSYPPVDQTASWRFRLRTQNTMHQTSIGQQANPEFSSSPSYDTPFPSVEQSREELPPKKKGSSKKRNRKPLITFLSLIFIVGAIFWYQQTKKTDVSSNTDFDLTGKFQVTSSMKELSENEKEDFIDDMKKVAWFDMSKRGEFQESKKESPSGRTTKRKYKFQYTHRGNLEVTNVLDKSTISRNVFRCVKGVNQKNGASNYQEINCDDKLVKQYEAALLEKLQLDEKLLEQMEENPTLTHYYEDKISKKKYLVLTVKDTQKVLELLKETETKIVSGKSFSPQSLLEIQLVFNRQNKLEQIGRLVKLPSSNTSRQPHIVWEESVLFHSS